MLGYREGSVRVMGKVIRRVIVIWKVSVKVCVRVIWKGIGG